MTSRWELREEACNFADKAYDAGRDNENKAATYAREALTEIAGIIGFQGYTHNPGKTSELVEAVKGNDGWGYVVNYREALNRIADIVGMEKRDWAKAENRAVLYEKVIDRGAPAYRLLREIAQIVEFQGDYLNSLDDLVAIKELIERDHVQGKSALGIDWVDVMAILRAYATEAGLPNEVWTMPLGTQRVIAGMKSVLKDREERQRKSTARGEVLDSINQILFTGDRPSTLTPEGHARIRDRVRQVVRESAELREEHSRLLEKIAQLEADNARVSNESFYRGRREGKQQAVDAIQRLQP